MSTDQGAANERAAARYIAQSGTNQHTNTCATSRAPAYEPGPCDCAGPLARGNTMGTFDRGHDHFDPTKAKERNQESK